jgi:hypothetical protein
MEHPTNGNLLLTLLAFSASGVTEMELSVEQACAWDTSLTSERQAWNVRP